VSEVCETSNGAVVSGLGMPLEKSRECRAVWRVELAVLAGAARGIVLILLEKASSGVDSKWDCLGAGLTN